MEPGGNGTKKVLPRLFRVEFMPGAAIFSPQEKKGKIMDNNRKPVESPSPPIFSQSTFYVALCMLYVLGLLAFAILMFETREELILLYLPFTFILMTLNPEGKIALWLGKGKYRVVLMTIIGSLMIATAVYFRTQYQSLLYERLGDYNVGDYLFSSFLIVLAFLFTWVEYGRAIPLLALLSLIYAYLGKFFPGFLYHRGLSISRIIAISATEINSGDGVLGSLPQIGITWIAIFTVFAGIAFGFGVLDYIIKITYNLFRKFRYGVPQVAVIASMIFGMFSGSGAANVAGTGSFTIPLMKRYRMPPFIAGSIESVASSGGQVMPPIMGAAAFVMASYLGKYYWQIMIIGFLPALIFYGCVALAVYIYSRQFLRIHSEVGEEEMKMARLTWMEMLDGLPLMLSIFVLVLVMSVFWVDVMLAGFIMIVTFLAVWVVWQGIRLPEKREFLKRFAQNFLKGVRTGAETTASITAMLACIGIIVAVLIQTGLAQKLSFAVVGIAAGNRVALILLTAGLCILFGMAATTVATYILTVTLAAPVLLDMGFPLLVTHFSVFYFAMLGLITPPVAPCCAVASGIAKDSFLKICWYSLKIGLPLLILPLVFFSHQSIVIHGSGTVGAIFLISLGMAGLILGVNLQYSGLKSFIKRVIYGAVGSLTLFYPNQTVGYIGMALCALFLVLELYRLSKSPDPVS